MHKYTEPLTAAMDNVLAYKLGRIALDAGKPQRSGVGDNIDRGLVLRKLLEESGFYLIMDAYRIEWNNDKEY
jgi:hypothetical protein